MLNNFYFIFLLENNSVYFFKTVKRLDPPVVEDVSLQNSSNGLGISISGGLFTESIPNDHGVFIANVIKGSVADDKLNIGDRLLSVNGKNLEYVTHDDAVAAIASSVKESNEIVLRVARVTKFTTLPTPTSSSYNNISPQMGSNNDINVKYVRFIFIKKKYLNILLTNK
jgi:hypothetical protein